MSNTFVQSLVSELHSTDLVPREHTGWITQLMLDFLKLNPTDKHECTFCKNSSYSWQTIADHDNQKSLWLTMTMAGNLVGFARVYRGEVWMMGVPPIYCDLGVARAMVQKLAGFGYTRCRLDDNHANMLPFLVRVGYLPTVWQRNLFDSKLRMYLEYAPK